MIAGLQSVIGTGAALGRAHDWERAYVNALSESAELPPSTPGVGDQYANFAFFKSVGLDFRTPGELTVPQAPRSTDSFSFYIDTIASEEPYTGAVLEVLLKSELTGGAQVPREWLQDPKIVAVLLALNMAQTTDGQGELEFTYGNENIDAMEFQAFRSSALRLLETMNQNTQTMLIGRLSALQNIFSYREELMESLNLVVSGRLRFLDHLLVFRSIYRCGGAFTSGFAHERSLIRQVLLSGPSELSDDITRSCCQVDDALKNLVHNATEHSQLRVDDLDHFYETFLIELGTQSA